MYDFFKTVKVKDTTVILSKFPSHRPCAFCVFYISTLLIPYSEDTMEKVQKMVNL